MFPKHSVSQIVQMIYKLDIILQSLAHAQVVMISKECYFNYSQRRSPFL